ncbi:hypothetical protein AURDEDRAFT_174790 [Auricularia subglabra TFB-10046 SS5]|nr:hypothetical protein AURDEDRAFT_174790 [Auricularia subglabra TFB-10046 SS5]
MSVLGGAASNAPIGADPPPSPNKQPNKQLESTDPLQAVMRLLNEALKQCEVVRPHLKAAASGKTELDKLVALIQHAKVVINVRSDVLTCKTLETSLSAAIDTAVERISSIVQTSAPAPLPGPGPVSFTRDSAGTFAAIAKAPERPEDRDVVIQLSTGELSTLRELERPALRAKVESVLRAIPPLSKVPIEFIRITLKGNLQIRARTINDAVLIHRHCDAWVSSLSASGKVHAARYTVAVNFVPTQFDPNAPRALDDLYKWNGDAVSHRQDLVEARWLNPKAVAAGDKASATMLVSLADPQSASELIFSSCHIKVDDSTWPLPCDTARYIPQPLQCFRCQNLCAMRR